MKLILFNQYYSNIYQYQGGETAFLFLVLPHQESSILNITYYGKDGEENRNSE